MEVKVLKDVLFLAGLMSQLSTFPSPASSKNNKPCEASSGDDVCCAQACSVPSQPCCSHPQPCLPGKHQCLQPGVVSSQCCQKKVMVLSGMFPWLPSDSHFPQAEGTCATFRYWWCRNQTLIWPVGGDVPTLHVRGQSGSSTAKPRLAQLSQFLTDKNSTLAFLNVQGYGSEVTSIWSKPCPRQGHHRWCPPRCWGWLTGGYRATAQKCWWTLHQPPWSTSTTSSRSTAHPSN